MKVASRADLERDWSATDIVAMHDLLDAMDAAQARASARQREESEAQARRRPR